MLSPIETTVVTGLSGLPSALTDVSSKPAQRWEMQATPDLLQAAAITRSIDVGNSSTVQTETSNDYRAPEAQKPTLADTAIAQLIRFMSLEEDWDGNSAARPLEFSLKDARAFVRSLAPESIVPKPALHADGHAILFLRRADLYAELEFLENKTISYFARQGDTQWSDEIYFDGSALPHGLLKIGFAIA
jgi:hypothetical protein